MNQSLYLSQSYQDAWDDYLRSIKSETFPVWDYIILTASNEHQASAFMAQIDARKDYLPKGTVIGIVPDEGGKRVGSGGATLSVLKYLKEKEESFNNKKILVIHSGGDSKRVPQYSALGKLFSPVPRKLPDGRSSTLFDEFIIAMSAVPGRIREGMVLLSGDVLLLFNPLLIDWTGSGAAAISFKESVSTGKNHGVFLRSGSGNVGRFLHKQSVGTLRELGAVNERDMVDIDTGALIFGTDLLDSLWSLISTDGRFDDTKYRKFVNDTVRLSLYGDFQYPLAEDSELEKYYEEKPEGEYSSELHECRTAVWNALRPYRLKLLRLAPAKFIHFGTTGEILALMSGGVGRYSDLGWSGSVNAIGPGYNSVISPGAKVGENVYTEVSYVHSDATVGNNTVLSYIEINDETIPEGVVLHGLKQSNGRFVCRIYGVEDNPKENRLFGRVIPASVSDTLWDAPVYPERDTMKEAVADALLLYERVISGSWENITVGKSLASGFRDADPGAILAWNDHMSELVAMNRIAEMIAEHAPVSEASLTGPLTTVQKKWMEDYISEADFGEEMRLHYYVGTALKDEGEISKAFSSLSGHILEVGVAGVREYRGHSIMTDDITVKLPLRVNFGGGWSDTPPYCNENGGTVLNAAIVINGNRPVSARLQKISERAVILESSDMGVRKKFDNIDDLRSVGDPFDPFVLHKAALLACGIIPGEGGSLDEIIDRLGSGFAMNTEVSGIPKGSGLGTSSILAAACVKALFGFLDIRYSEDDIYATVLCMEQIMSTGGGWQDQVGGVTDGIKYITSMPGLDQKVRVEHVAISNRTLKELNDRFCLVYTGQRRLARNLLRDVVGRYIGNEPDTVYALNEIQRIAALMRFELARGNMDAFAKLMDDHWEMSKRIDKGSANTLIDQIFDSVDDLIDGRMICGAGGGGFLQMILKRGVQRETVQNRLKSIFSDTDINVWDCTLV